VAIRTPAGNLNEAGDRPERSDVALRVDVENEDASAFAMTVDERL